MQLSNAYKDYLENWAWEKATGLYKRLRSRKAAKEQSKGETSFVTKATGGASMSVQESESENNDDYFQGLENFPFHITMLLLLVLMTLLNAGLTIAWTKSK